MTVARITSDFADRVGGDGFHDIKRAQNCACKIIWIILFLLAWTMVCYQVSSYIKKYFEYPIDTIVELKFDEAAVFPAVTFCNLNPVKHSELYKGEIFGSQWVDIVGQEPAHMTAGHEKGSWADTMEEFDKIEAPVFNGAEFNEDYGEMDEEDLWSPEHHPEEIKLESNFFNEFFMKTDEEKHKLGHKLHDMLIECIYKEKQCFPENFTSFLHPIYGNCYSFNSGFSRSDGGVTKLSSIQKTSMPGPSDESGEYLPLLAGSTGIRVQVHSQSAPPIPEDIGFTVSAGFATTLEIRKVALSRLPLPYNSEDCKTNFGPYQQKIQNYWPPANYTLNTCMKLCFQESLKNHCKCVDSELLWLESKSQITPCNISSTQEGFCAQKHKILARQGNYSKICQQLCSQPCVETDYEVQISSAQWPNRYYLDILKETAISRNPKLNEMMEQHGSDEMFQKNVLKLDVYYQSLNYKAISEQASYELVSLLADLGGAVDLWVGMSVLAMIQCFEFLFELVHYICCSSAQTQPQQQGKRLSIQKTPANGQVQPVIRHSALYHDSLSQGSSNLQYPSAFF